MTKVMEVNKGHFFGGGGGLGNIGIRALHEALFSSRHDLFALLAMNYGIDLTRSAYVEVVVVIAPAKIGPIRKSC